jgi:hypothetical protein
MKDGDLRRAIYAGLEYILGRQTSEGYWLDWSLPAGPSDMWTTAFVGYRLSFLGASGRGLLDKALRKAARWLSHSMLSDGGWGYNSGVGADADSTAHSILFLSRIPGSAPPASYERLLAFQCADGGFATFRPFGDNRSWSVSHPDVSAVALLALLTRLTRSDPAIEAGIQYSLRCRTADGVWNSFWWDSSLYATLANLRLLNSVRAVPIEPTLRSLCTTIPETPFWAALFLESLTILRALESFLLCRHVVERLIRDQASNGSWISTPTLRLTRRDCFEPWNSADSGLLFADPHRVFTTAAVISALSAFANVQGYPDSTFQARRWHLRASPRTGVPSR